MKRSKLKEKISLIYKVIIIIVCAIGLFINIKIAPGKEIFLYFTILSNIACLIFYTTVVTLYLMKKLKKNNLYYIFKGMVTMAITLTFIIFQLFLSENNTFYQLHPIANNFVHLFTPLLVIFDYIIFGEKGNLKKSYPLIWSGILIAYPVICYIYTFLGGTFADGSKYPYFYMDIGKYGIIRVAVNCLVIYVCYIAYGYLIYYLDNKIGKVKTKRLK